MMRVFVLQLFVLMCGSGCVMLCGAYSIDGRNNSKPLILTPYLEIGKPEEGQKNAKVPLLLGGIESYSGFLTVNSSLDRNLFFWYFPAESRYEKYENRTIPVILWLQGGPGVSSMYGLLKENGPLFLKSDGSVELREHRWSKHNHLLYLDSPVGTGFSFCAPHGYASNEAEISTDLYNALVQFFSLFPKLSKNDFFIFGESYGGRYVPSLGLTIHRNNRKAAAKINLKGLGIGDGMVDPQFMVYGEYLAQHGLIDISLLPQLLAKESIFKSALNAKDYDLAAKVDDSRNLPILTAEFNDTGIVSVYNYLQQNGRAPEEFQEIETFFEQEDIREAIHVGDSLFRVLNNDVNNKVSEGDGYFRTSPYTEELLEHYRVLHYVGQVDIILNYPMTENYANSLRWSGSQAYQDAERRGWFVGQELAGYVRSGGNLTLALVRNAGHMVPQDQPEWTLDLVTKFVNNDLADLGNSSVTVI